MWQPIETAPKDGTAILIYEPPPTWMDSNEAIIYVAAWVDWKDAWVETLGEMYSQFDPTHWQPLPEPPQ